MFKIIAFLILTQLTFGQKIGVYDKITKESVPYAVIFLDQKGFYTDKNGLLNLNFIEFDSISISHLNYETLKLNHKDVTDSLFLDSKIDILGEVSIVNYDENKTRRLKTTPRIFNAIMLKHTEIITCFCSKKSELHEAKILKLKFKLSKNKYHYDIEKTDYQEISLRINLYKNQKQYPKKEIYSYYPEVFSLKKVIEHNYVLEFDLTNKPFKFTSNGFCIGLEHLEFSNKHNKENTKELFFDLYKNTHKSYVAKTYIYYPLFHNDSIISYDDFHKNFIKNADLKHTSVFVPEIIIEKM